jgi:hypothetical protein
VPTQGDENHSRDESSEAGTGKEAPMGFERLGR